MRRRRSRTRAFGPFASNPTSALMRLGTLLIVLGLIYSWASKPQSWRWLEDNSAAPEAAESKMALAEMGPSSGGPSTEGTPVAGKPAADEKVLAAPSDVDPAEREQAQHLFEAVSDKTVLAPEEMPAYWRLMKWTRAQTFAAMDHRAARDVPRLGLLEQPDRYRGHLLRLRLHILHFSIGKPPRILPTSNGCTRPGAGPINRTPSMSARSPSCLPA